MNAVEIEEEVSKLAALPFDKAEFPYLFLAAFGNNEVTLKRLRSGNSNHSDIENGVLQQRHIHIATCDVGKVDETLAALRKSPKTAAQKAKFIVATDGDMFGAEDLFSSDILATSVFDLADRFDFFLPLAGISYTKELKEAALDRGAARRLNRLYVELLKDNPDWASAKRRRDMNHFMARLIFCFFAEDTEIFHGSHPFTGTVEKMSTGDHTITCDIIAELFRAMNTRKEDHATAGIKSWASPFPYVNGGLFSGLTDVPKFSKIARSYLLNIGSLDWKRINPDIFGSMIQAVADEEERGALGMHYTSVPNILKVLNPLFLGDPENPHDGSLRARLAEAGENARMLLSLRKRMAKIRVFDPACGSGNFLVIAYKEMRAIEAEINRRRGEAERETVIPLTNFRGIELHDFPAEIARLSLIIAEYQCDVVYRGQRLALAEFLPLDAQNWITCDNALRVDWLSVCPPTGTVVKLRGDDLFSALADQAEIEFENEGGETYICGNPPYVGATIKAPKNATAEMKARIKREEESRKADLKSIFDGRTSSWGSLDYVAGWFMKAADYGKSTKTVTAFVATNSICQGQQVPTLWPLITETGHQIIFAHTSFKWANLAKSNATVAVVIVGISTQPQQNRYLFSVLDDGSPLVQTTGNINAYLIAGQNIIVNKAALAPSDRARLDYGNKPTDGGHLILTSAERNKLLEHSPNCKSYVRRFMGSGDSIDGEQRFCLWIPDSEAEKAASVPQIAALVSAVEFDRRNSSKPATIKSAKWPHRFQEVRQVGTETPIVVPRHSSESRDYLPFALGIKGAIVADSAFAYYDAPLWNVAMLTSRLHLVWIATVCGKLETRYRYSNTLGWNTFPVPKLTEQNKADLTRCAENILLAREAHFPSTIADLYDPDAMPENLRRAHDANDALLESIYIGRRFKNDTERLEKLFQLYTQMTASDVGKAQKGVKKGLKA
jgi:hypothetical protein